MQCSGSLERDDNDRWMRLLLLLLLLLQLSQ